MAITRFVRSRLTAVGLCFWAPVWRGLSERTSNSKPEATRVNRCSQLRARTKGNGAHLKRGDERNWRADAVQRTADRHPMAWVNAKFAAIEARFTGIEGALPASTSNSMTCATYSARNSAGWKRSWTLVRSPATCRSRGRNDSRVLVTSKRSWWSCRPPRFPQAYSYRRPNWCAKM